MRRPAVRVFPEREPVAREWLTFAVTLALGAWLIAAGVTIYWAAVARNAPVVEGRK